jgi:hypothetical protein
MHAGQSSYVDVKFDSLANSTPKNQLPFHSLFSSRACDRSLVAVVAFFFSFFKSVPASNDSLDGAPSSENKLVSPSTLVPKSHHVLGGAQLVTASIKLSLLHHTTPHHKYKFSFLWFRRGGHNRCKGVACCLVKVEH